MNGIGDVFLFVITTVAKVDARDRFVGAGSADKGGKLEG